MFSKKKPADIYHDAIKRLPRFEAAHRKNLDALENALEARRANDVPGLRKACADSERSLAEALQAAADAHNRYWCGRRDALIPAVIEASRLCRTFDRIARCAGDASASPFRTVLQVEHAHGGQPDVLDESGVPEEGPDSELLQDLRGAWRHPSYRG